MKFDETPQINTMPRNTKNQHNASKTNNTKNQHNATEFNETQKINTMQ